MSNHAIIVEETGGPEVLKWKEVDVSAPGPGEVRIRQKAVGLNFIDTYFRSGLYPADAPFTPGNEGAGDVIAAGEGVTRFREGDRVAYTVGLGGYSEERNLPADRAVSIPDNVSYELAAVAMLKGLTARYLLRKTHDLKADDTVLFHAASGGVGLIAGQIAQHIGARIIGTASKEKHDLARHHGYDELIDYNNEDFAQRIKQLTNGDLCDVVYDSVGKTTLMKSLDCLRPMGLLVSFGQSSGKVDPLDLGLLSQKGSLFVTRPTLYNYIASRSSLEEATEEMFGWLGDGTVKIEIGQRFALKDAEKAHRALEGRETVGATVLLPDA
ncbi:quinone oxidoreductase family protein [Notoacmeibacter ruber]|uniref:Quinone oxidoreductase n=1 Tax=Notoacmeibacter ruber TaxID=2670375 RepID=A0A3L7JBK0_9HYPH|nr:quinone oxidoreductase [Notoacmeibacter ruber]RLQ87860.1 quinone oxidoreductase [Notoacmeibacter ruber]